MRPGLWIVISMFLMSACASAPPPVCRCPEPAVQPALPAPAAAEEKPALALQPLLESVVQIKVKVHEEVRAGQLKESFEYGTGFFVNERGKILTSAHVLAGVTDPRNLVVVHQGRPLQARILKVERESDLALLLVDAGTTKPLPLAEGVPELGEQVFAVGFPFVDVFTDVEPAVSVGHVAGASRDIEYEGEQVRDLLLTDAFVADGCSGGPLISEDGQVLGVLRFNLSRKGTWLGLSFAQPISSYLDSRRKQP